MLNAIPEKMFASAIGGLPTQQTDRAVWNSAMAACRRAKERVEAASDDHVDAAMTTWSDAHNRVFETPAPDLQALAWKLTYILSSDGDSVLPWADEFVEQTRRDVANLLGAPGDLLLPA